MAKKRPIRRTVKPQRKQPNWLLISAGTVVGAVVLFGLLFLALREPDRQTVAEYCAEFESACISNGSADAPVTIVEVSDYACGHCRDFNLTTGPVIEQTYVEAGQVEWVILPYALRDETMPAAEAAMCANEQGAFFEYHQTLFAMQSTPQAFTMEGYMTAAESVGIADMDSFNSCLNGSKYRSVINANRAVARQNGVSGTPTFFINDRAVEGNQPLQVFQQRIENLLGS